MTNPIKTEIYVRFSSEKFGTGMFESPCQNIEEAAGQFTEDPDCVSACAFEIDPKGRVISARDVTEGVIEHLKEMIRDDNWSFSPHPMLTEFFDDWTEAAKRDQLSDCDHDRVETEMLNI